MEKKIVLLVIGCLLVFVAGCNSCQQANPPIPASTPVTTAPQSQQTTPGMTGANLPAAPSQPQTSLPVTQNKNNHPAGQPVSKATKVRPESSADQKEQLMNKLQSETNGKIISFLYDDFEGDGQYEAFALTGKSEQSADGEGVEGEPWFVSEHELTKLVDDYELCSPPEIILIGGKKFIKYKEIYETSRPLFLLCVEDSKPKTVISGGAQDLELMYDGTFTVQQNTLDAMSDGSGRTVKSYWLYYNNGLHEYGGIEITVSEFLEFNGAANVMNGIEKAGGKLKNILYRANHIININYQTPQGMNLYVNLKYDDTSVSMLQTDDNSGVYLAALLPDIATYPAGFYHLNSQE